MAGETAGSPYYWKREYELYRSQMLATLPETGLTPPEIYACAEVPGACWIWMEDVQVENRAWVWDDVRLIARRLGRFGGAYLTGHPLPNHPWLSDHWHCAIVPALADVLRKYRVLALSDEIYSGTHYADDHVSLARFYPEGTIISNGLSKWCGAGGWRLGFFIFPQSLGWLADAMAAVASETFTSTSAPIQYAAVTALEDRPEMRDYMLHSRQILAALAGHAYRTLSDAGAVLSQPGGGFYLFPRFEAHRASLASRGIENGQSFCQRLLDETGVAALPGDCFGRPHRELSTRLAIVDFDGAKALQQAQSETVDESFVKRHCSRVTTAVEHLAEWAAN